MVVVVMVVVVLLSSLLSVLSFFLFVVFGGGWCWWWSCCCCRCRSHHLLLLMLQYNLLGVYPNAQSSWLAATRFPLAITSSDFQRPTSYDVYVQRKVASAARAKAERNRPPEIEERVRMGVSGAALASDVFAPEPGKPCPLLGRWLKVAFADV